MKRTRDNVLGYVWQAWSWYMLQSLQNALFGYFIQECLSLLDRYLLALGNPHVYAVGWTIGH